MNTNYLTPKIEHAQDIIKKSLDLGRVGIGLSGGSDSVVVLSLALEIMWDIPVIFVDTNYQFPETYKYIEKLRDEWDLNISVYKAKEPKYEYFIDKYGKDTKDFYYYCCMYHKIEPMMRAIREMKLKGFIVGIRGVEHPERAKEEEISYKIDLDPPHYRIHPILKWRQQDVIDYMTLYNILVNPLYDKGYTSLGCTYCTKPNPNPRSHERAGRARKRELIKHKLKKEGYN